MYWCGLCTLQHIVQLVLFKVFQLPLQLILKTTSENPDEWGIREGIAYLIKISTHGSSRNLILDLCRKLCLFLDVRHSLVNLVKRARHS